MPGAGHLARIGKHRDAFMQCKRQTRDSPSPPTPAALPAQALYLLEDDEYDFLRTTLSQSWSVAMRLMPATNCKETSHVPSTRHAVAAWEAAVGGTA